jgi:hypothetical protein
VRVQTTLEGPMSRAIKKAASLVTLSLGLYRELALSATQLLPRKAEQ